MALPNPQAADEEPGPPDGVLSPGALQLVCRKPGDLATKGCHTISPSSLPVNVPLSTLTPGAPRVTLQVVQSRGPRPKPASCEPGWMACPVSTRVSPFLGQGQS